MKDKPHKKGTVMMLDFLRGVREIDPDRPRNLGYKNDIEKLIDKSGYDG